MVSFARAAVVAVVCVLALAADALRLGRWRSLPERGLRGVFKRSPYSFNVKGNLNYCRRRTVEIKIDGTKDYTVRFNRAMAKLSKAGGGTLKLGRGTFVHSGQILIPSYVCLIGAGMGKTIIKLRFNSGKFKFSGNIRSVQSERITVMDLTQDGNKGNQKKAAEYGRYGYFHELSNFVYLKNVRIQNNAGYGFDPHGSKKNWSYYLVIDGCQSTRNGIDGFTLDQTKHVSMLNSKSWGNARHGFNLVTGLRTALVKGNIAYNNGIKMKNGCGFMAQNNQDFMTKNIRFTRNIATNNYKAGFCLKDVSGVTIEKCTIGKAVANPKSYCFQITGTKGRNVIRGNTCKLVAKRVVKTSDSRYIFNGKLIISGASKSTSKKVSKSTLAKFSGAPDAKCSKGIRGKGICCPKSCKKCGGAGCGKRGKNGVCCEKGIKSFKRACSKTGAPCSL